MSDKKKDALGKSLGIVPPDDAADNAQEEKTSEDDVQDTKIAKRKEIADETRNALKQYDKEDKGYDDDEEFTRDMLRDLAKTGMTLLKLQEEEMLQDASARNAETAAQVIAATTNAVDKLRDVGMSKEKLKIEKEKLELKKNASGIAGPVTQNIIAVGSFSDIVKNLKNEDPEVGECINAEVVEVKEENEENDAD